MKKVKHSPSPKPARHNAPPTLIRFRERWKDWKILFKEFLIRHLLSLAKAVIVLLLILTTILMLTGKLNTSNRKTPDADTPNSPTGILSYFTAPPLVKELRDLEYLPALTVEREVVVSQFKLQSDSPKPVSIHVQYPGTLVAGLDLDKKEGEWLQIHEDTLILNLPAVEILTPFEERIAPSGETILIETGDWSKAEMRELRTRAAHEMTRQSLAEDSCLHVAQENVRNKLLTMIRLYGYKHGVVNFAEDKNKKIIVAKNKPDLIPNDYNFYSTADGEKMIFYKNGSIINYSADISLECLYNFIEFCKISFPRTFELNLQRDTQGYTLLITNNNADVTTEITQHYIEFVKNNKDLRKDLRKMEQTLSKDLFNGEPCHIIEQDQHGEIVLDYSLL